MASTIRAEARYLIGVRWDGNLTKFKTSRIDNPAQYCIDRLWRRIEAVCRDWSRRVIYENPYPLVLAYGHQPMPNPGPIPDWEVERAAKEESYRAAQEASKADLDDDDEGYW